MKKLLVITPDLSLNGANVVLYEMLELMKTYMDIFILSTEGGTFEIKLKEYNISYEIKPQVNKSAIEKIEYDMVFLNTSSVHYYALFFQNCDVPVHWWFHESYEQLIQQKNNFVHLGLLSDNFHFYGVTPKVLRGLNDLYGVKAQILPMVVKDTYCGQKKVKEKRNIVFIPGAYTYIKGQDILLSVISQLPENLLLNTQFVFAGYKLPGQEEYYKRIYEFGTKFSNVIILDAISRDEVYEYYRKSICVIAPSRVDSTPTTIVEALMHQKLCIVSDGAGISELMTDCVNGFVFPVDCPDELFKRLLLVLSDSNKLDVIAAGGRKLYEKYFAPRVVNEILINHIS